MIDRYSTSLSKQVALKYPTLAAEMLKSAYLTPQSLVRRIIPLLFATNDETIDENKPYELFDPEYTWKRKMVTNFYAKNLLTRLFDKGVCIYESPKLKDIKSYCKEQVDTLWDEVKRFENPHKYYVDLSKPLWEMKERLLQEYSVK